MRWLLLLLAPWLTGAYAIAAARAQLAWPLNYPWPLLSVIGVFLVVSSIISWRKLPLWVAIRQVIPGTLALLGMTGAFLLVEGEWQVYALLFAFAAVPTLVLALLFLSVFDPGRYPVNGLSRINLACVILATFYGSFALAGLATFLTEERWLRWVAAPSFGVLFAIIALVTAHPNATSKELRRWTAFGALAGIHAGFLLAIVPVSMLVTAVWVMLFLAVPIRMRRYAYQPIPPTTTAWGEAIIGLLLFIATLAIARWA